ncbi:MAG: hypothetical protein HYS09_08570 [Chloroflexi bacterium]|nr:hypothetical protein [Chloroflexota bacterium]
MDTDYGIDLDAVFEVIDTAEVITFRFVTLHHRLLFDARHNENDGPLLKLVPRATSLEERFKAIKQLRPRFRLPEKITAIWWPKYVDSLVTLGVWDRVLRRISAAGFPAVAEGAGPVLEELKQRERVEVLNAITGKGYHPLWERAP